MGDWTDLLPRAGQGSGIPEFAVQALNAQSARRQNDAQTQVLGAQFQQLQAKATRKQEFDRRVAAVTAETNPSRQTKLISDLLMEFPEEKDAVKAGWDVKDTAAKRADLGWMGETVAAFDANKPELALTNLQRRRDADAAAGLDTSQDDSWIQAVKSGDKKAIAYVRGAMLAHIGAVDPDRFAQNYKTAAEPGSPFTMSPGQERIDPITGEVTAKAAFAPRVIPVLQPDGSTKYVEYQPGGGDPAPGETGTTAPSYSGGPVTVDILKPLFSAQESGGGYTARNPKTGAMGRWQVMPGTGAKLAKRLGLEWRPDMMLHDTAEDKAYQDKIGTAAMAEAVAVAKGDPAKAFSYYYSGSTSAYRNPKGNPKTAQYVADMMTRLAGGDPRANGAPQTAGTPGTRVIAVGAPKPGTIPADAPPYQPGTPVGGMSGDAIDRAAQRYNMTGVMPVGLGRRGDVQRAILSRAAQLANGDTGTQIGDQAGRKADTSALVALETKTSNVMAFERGAVLNGTIALRLSDKVGNGGVPIWNKWVNAGRRETGDPDVAAFNAAVTTFADEYSKIVTTATGGGAGTSDSARQHVYNLINTAQSPAQFRSVMSVLRADMTNRRRGIEQERAAIQARISGNAPSSASAPPVKVRSIQQARALPPGTVFIDPNGVRRVR